MIKIKQLSYSVNKHKILNNISCQLPSSGMVAIVGSSGSGKTTLLNCLSGLLDYEGIVEHDGVNISRQSKQEKDLFRIKRFGYIFQQYNLYENLSVEDNVIIPYQAISSDVNSKNFELKVNEILRLVGICNLRKKIVNKLSGGEKQRTAIARAIINSPKVVFADEPTGALDKENSIKIMEILAQIATNSLVLIVSHDMDLIEKYASQIMEIKDGEIVSISKINQKAHDSLLSNVKAPLSSYKTKLHFKFLLKYTFSQIKLHKVKTVLSGLVCSLGMLGIGLAFSLSNIISNSVISAYSGLIENDRVVIQRKENDIKLEKCAASEAEVNSLAQRFPTYIDGIGICYQANFEEIFEDKNNLTFKSDGKSKIIPGFGAREINDFLWLDYEDVKIFPNQVSELTDDEVVLGLTFGEVKYICEELKIKQSIESLGEYISNYGFDVVYDFAHYDWEYEDQQLLSVKGVCLTNTPKIYHDNHIWNKKMYEDKMRFPTKDDFNKMDVPPWTLNKVFYYRLSVQNSKFLDFARYEKAFDYISFEIPDKAYFSYSDNSKNESRILIFNGITQDLLPRYDSYLRDIVKEIKNPIFGSPGGYAIFPEYMMSGFANFMFFSSDEEKIVEISDLYDFLDEDEKNDIVMPGVLTGHFTRNENNGVGFQTLTNSTNLISGNFPNSYEEIVISSGLANKLNFSHNLLHFSCKKPSISKKSDFYIGSLKVVGVVDDNHYKLFHFQDWPITFFQSNIGISIFDMPFTSISYKITPEFNIIQAEKNLAKAFPKLSIINPLSDVVMSATQVGNNIQIFLLFLSVLVLIISLFIMIQSLGLYFDRIKKDIGIARIIGISKSCSSGFIYSYLGVILFGAFIFSCAELFIVSIFSSLSISSVTGGSLLIFISPSSIFAMLLFAMALGLISFAIIKKKTNKLSALDCLKRG